MTSPTQSPFPDSIPLNVNLTNAGVKVIARHGPKEDAFFYETTEMGLDYDGAPTTYSPHGCGAATAMDGLGNASNPTSLTPPAPGQDWNPDQWPGIAIDKRQNPRVPYIQQIGGITYYVSKTALKDAVRYATNPGDQVAYVDASKVNYVSLPRDLVPPRSSTAKLGDFATVYNLATGVVAFAIVADVGPARRIGEGSIALADALGIRRNHAGCPRYRVRPAPLTWIIFAGTHRAPPWPVAIAAIAIHAGNSFADWGGTLRIADQKLTGLITRTTPLAQPQLNRSLQFAQTHLWASKGTAYPMTATGPAAATAANQPTLTDTDAAGIYLDSFKTDLDALQRRGAVPKNTANSLTTQAAQTQTALKIPRTADGHTI